VTGRISLAALSATGRTLLIPLSGRAYGPELYPALGFRDERARAWAQRLEFDREPFLRDRRAVWGTLLRSQVFDDLAADFLSRNRRATVLNLGAGLCSRFYRAGANAGRWLELDVPEVLALRRQLEEETERHRLVPFDLGVADAWERLGEYLSGPSLLIAEGVLMFLEPAAVGRAFTRLSSSPGCALVFDYLHPWVMRHSRLQPPSFRVTGARYSWAGGPLARTLAAHPGLRIARDRALTERFPPGLRLADAAIRAVAGASLYDIAVVEAGAES
jgi:O-methyltransferase involved in polyketide biosynthesis